MSRAKKPCRYPQKYKTYGNVSMRKALEEVRNGGNFKTVSKRRGINRTNLLNHVKGIKCKKIGRPIVLTNQKEELLVHTLIKLGERSCGSDRLQLQRYVQDYVRRMDRSNPFHNEIPGPDWCLMFERRWSKEISWRVD